MADSWPSSSSSSSSSSSASGFIPPLAMLSEPDPCMVEFQIADNEDMVSEFELGVLDCFPLLEHEQHEQQQQLVMPPTMHPNLVSTLKSIISMEQQDPVPPAMPQVQDLSCSSAKNPHEQLAGLGGRMPALGSLSQAAVVPIDLIKNRRPFKCLHPGCDKTFKNPQTMKMHLKSHYSDDDRRKAQCSLTSSAPSCFRAGHNKKIPSRCPVCRRAFVGLYELRRHFGRKHSEGEKLHCCAKCGKRFYIEIDLRDHDKLCGEPPVKCSKCGMRFALRWNLHAHIRARPECQDHSSSSSDCQYKFASSSFSPLEAFLSALPNYNGVDI